MVYVCVSVCFVVVDIDTDNDDIDVDGKRKCIVVVEVHAQVCCLFPCVCVRFFHHFAVRLEALFELVLYIHIYIDI